MASRCFHKTGILIRDGYIPISESETNLEIERKWTVADSLLPTSAKVDLLDLKTNGQLAKVGPKLLGKGKDSPAELERAASGFESILVNQMINAMWETVETTGLLGENSHEAGIYRDMFNQALSDSISKGSGIGVKGFLKTELIKQMQHQKDGNGADSGSGGGTVDKTI